MVQMLRKKRKELVQNQFCSFWNCIGGSRTIVWSGWLFFRGCWVTCEKKILSKILKWQEQLKDRVPIPITHYGVLKINWQIIKKIDASSFFSFFTPSHKKTRSARVKLS